MDARPQSFVVVINAALLINVGAAVIAAALYDLAVVAAIGVYVAAFKQTPTPWTSEKAIPIKASDEYRQSEVADWLASEGLSHARQLIILRSLVSNCDSQFSDFSCLQAFNCSFRGRLLKIRFETTSVGTFIHDATFEEVTVYAYAE